MRNINDSADFVSGKSTGRHSAQHTMRPSYNGYHISLPGWWCGFDSRSSQSLRWWVPQSDWKATWFWMGAAFCKIAVWKYWLLGSALIQKHNVNSPTLMYSPGNNKWFWKVPVRYCPGHRMILSFGSWWIPLCGGASSQIFLSRFVCAELVGWGCSTGRHPVPHKW